MLAHLYDSTETFVVAGTWDAMVLSRRVVAGATTDSAAPWCDTISLSRQWAFPDQ